MADTLKENWYAGKQIKKSQIPAFHIQRYGVNNLCRYHQRDTGRATRSLMSRRVVSAP